MELVRRSSAAVLLMHGMDGGGGDDDQHVKRQRRLILCVQVADRYMKAAVVISPVAPDIAGEFGRRHAMYVTGIVT